jgi:hypothetical protein
VSPAPRGRAAARARARSICAASPRTPVSRSICRSSTSISISRIRGRDEIALEPDEEAFTGGSVVYASPGLRLHLPRGGAAVYALVQVPVYQRVNALQLTADANYVAGVQTRF